MSLTTESVDLQTAIDEHQQTITDETLASSFKTAEYPYTITVKVDGVELTISLEKS